MQDSVEMEIGAGCAGTEDIGRLVTEKNGTGEVLGKFGRSGLRAPTKVFLARVMSIVKMLKTRGTRRDDTLPVKVELYKDIAVEAEVAEKTVIVLVLDRDRVALLVIVIVLVVLLFWTETTGTEVSGELAVPMVGTMTVVVSLVRTVAVLIVLTMEVIAEIVEVLTSDDAMTGSVLTIVTVEVEVGTSGTTEVNVRTPVLVVVSVSADARVTLAAKPVPSPVGKAPEMVVRTVMVVVPADGETVASSEVAALR